MSKNKQRALRYRNMIQLRHPFQTIRRMKAEGKSEQDIRASEIGMHYESYDKWLIEFTELEKAYDGRLK